MGIKIYWDKSNHDALVTGNPSDSLINTHSTSYIQLGEELGMVKLQRPILHVLLSELKTYSSNEEVFKGSPRMS